MLILKVTKITTRKKRIRTNAHRNLMFIVGQQQKVKVKESIMQTHTCMHMKKLQNTRSQSFTTQQEQPGLCETYHLVESSPLQGGFERNVRY